VVRLTVAHILRSVSLDEELAKTRSKKVTRR
jgi:hypothetical protein